MMKMKYEMKAELNMIQWLTDLRTFVLCEFFMDVCVCLRHVQGKSNNIEVRQHMWFIRDECRFNIKLVKLPRIEIYSRNFTPL